MVRLLCLLICLASFSQALAARRPGPPPWTCKVIEACNERGICASVVGLPLGFRLFDLTGEERRFAFDEGGGSGRVAVVYPSLEEAKRLIVSASRDDEVGTVLIPYDKVFDAVGFSAYAVSVRGTGERIVGPDHTLIVCGS